MPRTSSLKKNDSRHAIPTSFPSFDGHTLAMFDWPLAERRRPRAVVLIVHGLGEHAWRYDRLACELNAAGFLVRSYDQRGHGESAGSRGCLPHPDALLHDLSEVVDHTRSTLCQRNRLPLVLLGHSLGGLVGALWAARAQANVGNLRPAVDALVLSSPALDVQLSWWERWWLGAAHRWLANITVSSGIKPHDLSHDPAVVSIYRSDPLVHDHVSFRLGRFIADAGPEVMAHAPQWCLPTLLMYAGGDRVVNPKGSQRFAQLTPVGVVEVHCFEHFYHEIFNETHRKHVVGMLIDWLNQRL